MMLLSVFLLFLVFGEVVGPRKLHILFVVSRTGSFVSSGVIPMVDYAMEEINNRSSILSNYTISYEEIQDSKVCLYDVCDQLFLQCHGRTATNIFMDKFFDDPKPTYVALVGCGCSVATIPVAQLSHYWNVPHITIASAASILGDKSRFRSLFQILPTIDGIPYTLTVFAKRLGWRQLAVITQQESLFIGMTRKLNLLFQESGLILDDSITIETGKPLPKERLFNWENGSSQRIIVLFTYSTFSYPIMCEAYKRKMFSPKYVWIFYDSPKLDWFDPNVTRSCKPPEIDRILNGSLLLLPEAYSSSTNNSYISSSGMTPSRFKKLNRYLLRQPQYQGLPFVGIEGSGYDAIWAMSLGLEEASRRIAVGNDSGCNHLQGELVPLEEFTYDNPKMGCVLQKSIASVKFNGITGPFKFNKNRTRTGNAIIIYQFSVNENGIRTLRKPMIRVVNRDGIRNSIFFFIEPLSSLWGRIPYDGYAQKNIREYNVAFVTVFTLLASAGVMFAGVCLVFNIIFRKRKIVKLSSPNLNCLLILGSVILYSHMYLIVYYFTGYDEIAKQSILCNLSVWSLSFGYSLCFSVILAKSGRVYYIFANPSSKKKTIKDWMLFIIVALLTGIDVLLLIIETSTRSTRVETKIVPDTQQFEATAQDGTLKNYYFFLCDQSRIFLAVKNGYRVLLQLVGIFFAFHTRKIKIKGLKESTQIGYIIYFNTLFLIILVLSDYVIKYRHHDITVSVEAVISFIQATLFLVLFFVPNMMALYRDPKGEYVFKKSTPDAGKVQLKSLNADKSSNDTVARMRARVKELEEQVDKLRMNVRKFSLPATTESFGIEEEKEHYL